jgi:hypothetical protein
MEQAALGSCDIQVIFVGEGVMSQEQGLPGSWEEAAGSRGHASCPPQSY